MPTKYIEHAMRHAHYELMENGRFFGSSRSPGCWGEGATLEECRRTSGALEDCCAGAPPCDPFEVIDDIDINYLIWLRPSLSNGVS